MIMPAVNTEVVEPAFLHEPVHPALLADFVAGVVLRRADFHRLKFRERRLAHGDVGGLVFLDEVFQQVGAFEDDAAAGRLLREFAKSL